MQTQNGLIKKFVDLKNHYLPHNSIRGRLVKGAFWITAGTVIYQIANLTTSVFTAHILGQERFGELGMIRNTVLIVGVLAGLGLGVVAMKYVAEFRDKDPDRTGKLIGFFMKTSFIIGGVVSIGCFFFAHPLAKWGLNAEYLAPALQIGCLLPLVNSLSGVQYNVILGFESFRLGAATLFIDAFFMTILSILGAWLGGVHGAVLGLLFASGVGFIFKQIVLQKECTSRGIRIHYHNSGQFFRLIWKAVLPAVLLGCVLHPFDWLARLLVARQEGGFLQIGSFTAAYTLGQFVLFLPKQIVSSSLPVFSNLISSGQLSKLPRLIKRYLALNFVTALLISSPFLFFSGVIMSAYGKSFGVCGKVLVLMSLANIIWSMCLVYINTLFALGRVWLLAVQHAILGVSIVVITYLLLSQGANGLAIGHLTGWILMFLVQSWVICRQMFSPEKTLDYSQAGV